MKRKIASLFLLIFFSSIVISAYSATDNVIVRVGYPRLGQNQYVGTVRIYESDATIDSIQNGDVFSIFVENAEFMTPPTLTERGRFDLNVLSGGNDGDSYITYEFVPSSTGGTGRVIIDFAFDDMRVLGGDVKARVDSVQSGVSSGYFSLGGSEEKKEEKPKVTKEEVTVSAEQLQEAKDKKVNIVVRSNDYQLVLPYTIAEKGDLNIKVRREVPLEAKYLTELFSIEINDIKEVKDNIYLKIKDPDVKDKRNVKGVLLEEAGDKLLMTHYDAKNDHIIIRTKDISKKISLVRASNNRELIFDEDHYVSHEGKKYVPVRQSAAYYGWDVTWNPFTRTVNLQKDEKTIEVKDYIIVRERSYISAEFLMKNLEASVFELEDQVVLKFN